MDVIRIRREIRIRDKFHKIFKKYKNPDVLAELKRQRNKVNNMKKYARETFYEKVNDIIDTYNNTDPKSYWRLMRRLIKQSGQSQTIPPLINPTNLQTAADNIDKADILNKYFCSISDIDDTETHIPIFESRTAAVLESIVITNENVSDILKTLKLGKASGHDKISHTLLKNTAISIARPLTVFNMSLRISIFPEYLKQAIVLQFFKKGDRHLVSNYRPISLLSCVSKIFERVVFRYVHNYFVDNSLFYTFQSGLMANHSTVHQLIEIYHTICHSFEEKKHACLIVCDISKPFDRVWHKGLIVKLKAYWIKGKILEWITSYITNRQQKVLLDKNYSTTGNLRAGVPRGSVLGPLMFLIYINDIADNILSISRLFADDTSLSYASASTAELETTLNADLENLNKWSKRWLTTFNTEKHKFC
ncbi:RNA-directed DNA polymerase from transposon BS [Mizuhopecten yessoensis]|uniref:RNA-directed DNA polymerase from transposon BS n=1 Tax=Mizuhopecten yessoensis TaxID=6573 RepID=A0A210QXJ7_MIZYE|nr:RNA-directed DNA polymerase from transposon BS [Mizuhopecten yessoensis]